MPSYLLTDYKASTMASSKIRWAERRADDVTRGEVRDAWARGTSGKSHEECSTESHRNVAAKTSAAQQPSKWGHPSTTTTSPARHRKLWTGSDITNHNIGFQTASFPMFTLTNSITPSLILAKALVKSHKPEDMYDQIVSVEYEYLCMGVVYLCVIYTQCMCCIYSFWIW